jgi:hypothetical protein
MHFRHHTFSVDSTTNVVEMWRATELESILDYEETKEVFAICRNRIESYWKHLAIDAGYVGDGKSAYDLSGR